MNIIRYASLSLSALLLCVPLAHSALQGDAAANQSTATTTITLAIEPNIQISNVSDLVIDVTDRSKDVEIEESICVRGNTGGRYSVTASATDGGNAPFQLQSEKGDNINYQVYFRSDLKLSGSKDQLIPGQRSPYYDVQSESRDCNGDDTAAFIIIVTAAEMREAEAGIYTGLLGITASVQ